MTKDEKALFDVEVLKQKIEGCEGAIRGLELDIKAAKIAEDEEMKTRATGVLAKQLKLKDAYQQLLDNLREGVKDESVS